MDEMARHVKMKVHLLAKLAIVLANAETVLKVFIVKSGGNA